MGDEKKKCEEYLNGWKRAMADYQNLVKDVAKEKLEFVKFANQNLILELLPILDNFKLAFSNVPDVEKDGAWMVGFAHIKKQLEDFLKENGVEEIKTIDEKFDPMLHEAVGKAENSEKESGIIVEEKKPGYKLHGKVVQAAKVVVT
ncbi:nucleotide exchange factor GrpE [Candidatus Falkowbacteria bacterium]|nr:nucleotide exchange factor GrpE [Candidatus Falkowbacteria bacterium]